MGFSRQALEVTKFRSPQTGAGRFATAAVGLIAAAGLVQWLSGGFVETYLPGATMRPLTSVALAFLATALYCVATGRERLGRLLALPVCLYAVAVLAAELVVPANAWTENRLVSLPNSALALSLGGIGVAVWPSRRESRVRCAITWTCGVMTVLIAITALCGRVFDIESMRSSSDALTSWLAALGYGSFGVGMLALLPATDRRRNWLPISIGVLTIAAGVTVWLVLIAQEKVRIGASTQTVLGFARHQVGRELDLIDDAMTRLADRLAAQGDEDAFRREATIYLRDYPDVASLEWRHRAGAWTLARDGAAAADAAAHLHTITQGTRIAEAGGRTVIEFMWRNGGGTLAASMFLDPFMRRVLEPIDGRYAAELRSGDRRWFALGSPDLRWTHRAPLRAGDETLTLAVAPQTVALGLVSSHQPDLVLLGGFGVAALLVLSLRLASQADESARRAERANVGLRDEIDAHRRTGVVLQTLRDRTDSVLATISDGFVTIDRDRRLTYVNASAAQMLALDPVAAVGQPFETSALLARHREQLSATLLERRTADFEIASHASRVIAVRAFAQPDGIALYLRDVSAEKEAALALAATLQRAERQAMQLRALRHVSLIASSKLGDPDLPNVLVEEVREAIGAHIGSATLDATCGASAATIVSLSDKYAQWRDAETAIGVHGDDRRGALRLSEAALAARGAREPGQLPLRGLLSVPLRDRRGGVIGVLQLSDRTEGDFTAEDELILLQFAQTFSISIGWSKLIDELFATQADLRTQLGVLARSRALLAEAERVAQLGSWEVELLPGGERRRTWSEQMFRLFGLEPGSDPPDPDAIWPLVNAQDSDKLNAAVARAFEHGEPFALDYRIVPLDGIQRWIHSEARVVAGTDEAPARIVGTSQDVTERKSAEQQAIARAEVLRAIASGAPLSQTLVAIAELYERRFPDAACSILLLQDGRLHTAAAPKLPEEYSRLIDGIEIGPAAGSCGTAAWRREQVIVADVEHDPLWAPWRDAALRFGLRACWSTPVPDKDGNVVATFAVYYRQPREPVAAELEKIASVVAIAAIALDAERARARIADREQRLRSLFAYVPEAVYAIGADGRIVDCNHAALEMSGHARERILGCNFADFVAPESRDEAASCMSRALAGEVCRFDHEGVRPDGSRYNAATTTLPIVVDGETAGIYVIARDVTRHTQARVELETALRTTAANNRELEEFAFVASHDLQEPLRKVRAFGDRLRTHAGDTLDAQAVDYIERMRAAAERMQRLIDDLLAYSRVSTSSRSVSRVDLDQVLREVLVDLDARVAESGATVAFDTLPPIEADATQMRQLLQNLIANALKFRDPARAVRVEVRARPIAQPGSTIADWLRIEVEDNGIGFDNRYGERIFAPFQRLHGRNEYEGSGIGLAIVRRIVERHGGLLAAHGQPGLGARFTIEMPMRQTQPRTSNPATKGRHA